MRRGHPGIVGWRNDNPRHFKPRNGGNQHFRPSKGYGLLDQHRFPPPGPRPYRPSLPYKHRPNDDRARHESRDRGKYRPDYRSNHYPRNQEVTHLPPDKYIYNVSRPSRSTDTPNDNSGAYTHEPPSYYESPSKQCHMNSMGDIDDRYVPPRETFRHNPVSNWARSTNQLNERSHRYEHNKSNRYESVGESSKLPLYDYTGHRPPSSDHYGGNPTPVINNSESFNRSVDDTVDLIRKRLLNRNDPHSEANEPNLSHHPSENQMAQNTKESIRQHFRQEQPIKKKVNRPRQSEKSNNGTSFTKIKSKIVNQLFKMDKEKIHKLMDNPNSSSKFEYAISSLITESQYSFNRHLRSVAEKSLHNSRSIDFIQNDNNTIYEDTFMKQMQCILDPQDTVLLEDIKPIVMAELSKALELDEYEQQFEGCDEEVHQDSQQRYEHTNYSNEYYDNLYTYDDYEQCPGIQDHNLSISQTAPTFSESEQESTESYNQSYDNNQSSQHDTIDTIYESRTRKTSENISSEVEPTRESPQYIRRSLDSRLNDLFATNTHTNPENPLYGAQPECQPMFVPDAEPLEEDDDPFAELDKQYHVAVDHSFIENDDSSSLNLSKDEVQVNSPNNNTTITLDLNTPEKEFIKQEIDHHLQDMANSPLKFPSYVDKETKLQEEQKTKNLLPVKNEPENSDSHGNTPHVEKPIYTKPTKEIEYTEISKSDNRQTCAKSSASGSRKRSIDQSPSHRKEKRKKSNSVCLESDKQARNKNTDVNETNESFCKKKSKKEDKLIFPEKHTKRKEPQKKTNQRGYEARKRLTSTENITSIVSPKESHNTPLQLHCKSQSKSEVKTTLKTFDLFTEQPKKINIHHAHRNTALAPTNTVMTKLRPKCKETTKISNLKEPTTVTKNMVSVQTQTIERNTCSRFSQTERKKHLAKATQSNIPPLISINKDVKILTDPLERMKEIDMEIQVLLQEKFKLYSSIESKESGKNSLHTLGMAVLNVSPFEEESKDNLSEEKISTEDSIVDDFTNIPVEELEQIAFESIEADQTENSKPETRITRLRDKEKSKSQSPTPSYQKKNNRKRKSPNISLIEQIISDERPIEEIISLDDLEDAPAKTRLRKNKSKRKPKRKSSVNAKPIAPVESQDFILKECSVLMIREDFSKYLPTAEVAKVDDVSINTETTVEPQINISDEPLCNDVHFDMLDVSEDIVIGDICEIKSTDDKEVLDTADIPITEDIILDNSQSSIEEQQGSTSDPKENECKMFDYSSDENLRRDSVVVTGNAEAVLAVECIENNFIAACLDGNVYYFSGDGQLITTLRGSNLAVTCLTIVKEKYGTTIYTGSLDSRIRYYDLETGLEKGPECNVLSPIQTMDRAWDTVFVGTRTGFVLQFECKNNMLIPISTVQFSEQSILALRALKEGPRKVLLVAARSEDVTIKDAQTGLLLRTLAGPKMTVYTLLYEDGKIYCGTSSSQIHVYDYSSGSHVGAHEGGKGAVCLRAAGGLLFAGCYDGCVYVYREGERRPFAQLRGPGLMLLSLAVVGSKIIAGYKDRSLYIWKIPLSILQEMIL